MPDIATSRKVLLDFRDRLSADFTPPDYEVAARELLARLNTYAAHHFSREMEEMDWQASLQRDMDSWTAKFAPKGRK